MEAQEHETSVCPEPIIFDGLFATFVYFVTTLGFGSAYSAVTTHELLYRKMYFEGVFSSRIIGRDLDLEIHQMLVLALGARANFLGSFRPLVVTGNLFTAITIMNYAWFILLIVLIRRALKTSYLPLGSQRELWYVLIVMIGSSFMVITPYDTLSLVLLGATLAVLDFKSVHRWWLVPIVIIGMLNRESEFVAIAAIVAMSITGWQIVPRRIAITSVLTAGSSYAVLHSTRSQVGTLWEDIRRHVTANLHAWHALVGLALGLAVLGLWWLITCQYVSDKVNVRGTRLWFLGLSAPYWIVAFTAGAWWESIRLLIPLIFVDFWILTRPSSSRILAPVVVEQDTLRL